MTHEYKKQLAIEYIKSMDIEIEGMKKFYKFYSFSTENLTDYFIEELINNKKVLVTGSSTDQIITSQLYNASKITDYDINPLVEYMYNLKISALKVLNIDEFINYFYFRDTNRSTLNYKTYEKIRTNMNGNSLDFWDTLYDVFNPITIRKNLFVYTDEQMDKNNYKKLIPYLDLNNYNKLKEKELLPVEFINCNVTDVYNNVSDKYDLIYFSNIFSRIEMDDFYSKNYLKNLYKFMINILEKTNENGKVILDYFYNISSDQFNDYTSVFHRILFPIRIFNCEENVSYKEIPSVFGYSSDTDLVLTYTKKNK